MTEGGIRVLPKYMRFHLALVVASSLVPAIAHADRDPFATRHPPPGSVPSDAAPREERVPVTDHEDCDCEDGTISRRTAARITGVTGLALGLGALALGFYEKDRYESATDVETANEARDVLRYAGTGMLAAGVVMVGVSVYLYATMPESPRRTVVAPVITPDELGVAFARSF